MTKTKAWTEMTTQEKHLALAEMMGICVHKGAYSVNPSTTNLIRCPSCGAEAGETVALMSGWGYALPYSTDYTTCFEGPVKWARAQGFHIEISICGDPECCSEPMEMVVAHAKDGKTHYPVPETTTPDAICWAILKAWKASK